MRLADFARKASQMLGVSLRALRGTTQLMTGVSLQAKWDTGQVGHDPSSNNNNGDLSVFFFEHNPLINSIEGIRGIQKKRIQGYCNPYNTEVHSLMCIQV